MNLFGLYVPGSTWLHRLGVGWKYVLLLLLTVPVLVVARPVPSLAAFVASVLLLASTRTGARLAFALPWALWILLAVLSGYQLVVGRPDLAVVVSVNLAVTHRLRRALHRSGRRADPSSAQRGSLEATVATRTRLASCRKGASCRVSLGSRCRVTNA